LLSAGAACIILGIVGGGAKAFGVVIPILTSTARQAGLVIVGLLFLTTAYILGDDLPADASVAAYRQAVHAVRWTYDKDASDFEGASSMAARNEDGTYDRDRFISAYRGASPYRSSSALSTSSSEVGLTLRWSRILRTSIPVRTTSRGSRYMVSPYPPSTSASRASSATIRRSSVWIDATGSMVHPVSQSSASGP